MSKYFESMQEMRSNEQDLLCVLNKEINYHFLFNTLESIRSYAMDKEFFEIADMIFTLASMLRYNIKQPNNLATFQNEIECIKKYLKVEHFRFPDQFEVIWEVNENNQSIMNCPLPVLTLQPIVENSFKHGLKLGHSKIIITIGTIIIADKLTISIKDNGMGISEDRLNYIKNQNTFLNKSSETKQGVSLINIDQRIKYVFGENYGLEISSDKGQGTNVNINVPLINR